MSTGLDAAINPFLPINRRGHRMRVTHILSIGKQLNLHHPEIKYDYITFEDNIHCLKRCVVWIDDTILNGGCVLVHCQDGRSQGAIVICALIIQHTGAKVEDAIKYVRLKRSVGRLDVNLLNVWYQRIERKRLRTAITRMLSSYLGGCLSRITVMYIE
jgi:protein-tyrosine phosphatase